MAEQKTITRLTDIKIKPGYYRNGKLLYNDDDFRNWKPSGGFKPGDVVVDTLGVGWTGQYSFNEYIGPNHKGNMKAKPGFQRTITSSTKGIDSSLIPEALKGQVKATQETGYYQKYGHGGSSRRWIPTDPSKTVTFGSKQQTKKTVAEFKT